MLDRTVSVGPAALAWFGNAAKMRIIQALTADAKPKTIFDFGAGRGAGWPETLALHPEITLICYEPSGAAAELRKAVPSAQVFNGDIGEVDAQADYIVSFSVFEHVYDRGAYLANARRLLKPGGKFFLNYDDGHFRKRLDLNDTSNWSGTLREHLRNLAAPVLPRIGQVGHYQARVNRHDVDLMVSSAGFETIESRYENLASLKSLSGSVPADDRARFATFWLDVEERLNQDFDIAVKSWLGDPALLWREMASRTLSLR